MGCLHLTALTALTLLRAEGCDTVFGADAADDDANDLHLSSEVSQQTLDLAVTDTIAYLIAYVQRVAVPAGQC
jgi:hypothetical protein